MTGTFDGRREATLEFEARASNATRQDLSLLIHKLEQEVRIFVVNILDPCALEAAVFLLLGLRLDAVDRGGSNYRIFCHSLTINGY